MENEEFTAEHAIAVLRFEETQSLLSAQIEATARARVRAMQLEQQNAMLNAELEGYRLAEAERDLAQETSVGE